jgi:hypothetical protein
VRWLLALALGAGALAVLAVVLALGASRDLIPGDVKACVREGGGTIVRGPEGLQPIRDDLVTRAVRPGERLRLGPETQALLLEGTRARVLVVAGPSNPQLGGREFLERLYADPSRWSVVASEVDPRDGLLLRCARRAAR